MKWTCQKFQNWILQSLDEPLPAEKEFKLNTHLKKCAACRDFQRQVQASRALLVRERQLVVPKTLKKNLLLRVERDLAARQQFAQPTQPETARLVLGFRLLLTAAAIAFVFFFGKIIFHPGTESNPSAFLRETTVIESAQYQGRPADLFVFESPDKKTTFIWID